MNTSLGYSLFDDSTMNYVYDDLNGTTTRISQAAEWAAQKGILCTTSAGNSEQQPGITSQLLPNADGILTVGAVDADGHTPCSGLGSHRRRSGQARCHGVGGASCLSICRFHHSPGQRHQFLLAHFVWSRRLPLASLSTATAQDIRNAITTSAHLYAQPNDSMGYGIPDFRKAFELLDEAGAATWAAAEPSDVLVFPNPSSDGIVRWLYNGDEIPVTWQIFDAGGHLVQEGHVPTWSTAEGVFPGPHGSMIQRPMAPTFFNW